MNPLRSNKKLENFGFLAMSKPFSVSIILLNAVVVATAVMLAVITVRAVIIVAIRHVLFCDPRFPVNHCSTVYSWKLKVTWRVCPLWSEPISST